ncbi:MAG TPA: hypothetical protein VMQ65_06400 [Candidatus Limnocylindria bacterium]|nr:hypothetical protein [Candidatus Limnocylindria bacterium]
MALRRVVLAATVLSFAALMAWAGGLGPAGVPEAIGIRSVTVDAPFRAPEPTAGIEVVPGVTDVEAAAALGESAAGSVDQLASRDGLMALLALLAIVGFGAGMGTLRAEPRGGRRLAV